MDNKFEVLPWMEKYFDERQIKEIKFNSLYAIEFYHGTDGHNMRMIVAKLAGLISEIDLIMASEDKDYTLRSRINILLNNEPEEKHEL